MPHALGLSVPLPIPHRPHVPGRPDSTASALIAAALVLVGLVLGCGALAHGAPAPPVALRAAASVSRSPPDLHRGAAAPPGPRPSATVRHPMPREALRHAGPKAHSPGAAAAPPRRHWPGRDAGPWGAVAAVAGLALALIARRTSGAAGAARRRAWAAPVCGLWAVTGTKTPAAGAGPRRPRAPLRPLRSAARPSAGPGAPEPAVLVVAADPAALAASAAAVARALRCRVVGVRHSGARGVRGGEALALRPPNAGDEWFALEGGAEEAVMCALDPSDGLLRWLGLAPGLCVVGYHPEPSIGADADTSASVAAARAAAVLGVPAVAACLPVTAAPDGPSPAAVDALAEVLRGAGAALGWGGGGAAAAANCPRAHFPFPTEGRWAALGSPQLPLDAELQRSLRGEAVQYAAADCWSMGDDVPGAGAAAAAPGATPAQRRAILRRAFRDADVFLCLHVGPRWTARGGPQPFASTRPGVLWHQEQVAAQGPAPAAPPEGAPAADVWGRTLPVQRLEAAQPSSRGATFVRQLNTERVLRDAAAAGAAPAPRPLPAAFTVGRGTMVMDPSGRGDVDAVFGGRACVSTLQTWPHSHPFSLLDGLKVEALRQDARGFPLWLSGEDAAE